MNRAFKIEKEPYEEGQKIFEYSKLTIDEGINIFVGCNRSGKSTLLNTIKYDLETNHIPVIEYDNLHGGSSSRQDDRRIIMIYVKTEICMDNLVIPPSKFNELEQKLNNIETTMNNEVVFHQVSQLENHTSQFTLNPGEDLQAILNINTDVITTKSLIPSSGEGNILLNKAGYYEIIVFHNNVGAYNWRSYIRAYDFSGTSECRADWNSSHIHNVYVPQNIIDISYNDIAIIITIEEMDSGVQPIVYPPDWFIGFKYYSSYDTSNIS